MFDKIQSTYFKRVTTGVLALFMTASSGFSYAVPVYAQEVTTAAAKRKKEEEFSSTESSTLTLRENDKKNEAEGSKTTETDGIKVTTNDSSDVQPEVKIEKPDNKKEPGRKLSSKKAQEDLKEMIQNKKYSYQDILQRIFEIDDFTFYSKLTLDEIKFLMSGTTEEKYEIAELLMYKSVYLYADYDITTEDFYSYLFQYFQFLDECNVDLKDEEIEKIEKQLLLDINIYYVGDKDMYQKDLNEYLENTTSPYNKKIQKTCSDYVKAMKAYLFALKEDRDKNKIRLSLGLKEETKTDQEEATEQMKKTSNDFNITEGSSLKTYDHRDKDGDNLGYNSGSYFYVQLVDEGGATTTGKVSVSGRSSSYGNKDSKLYGVLRDKETTWNCSLSCSPNNHNLSLNQTTVTTRKDDVKVKVKRTAGSNKGKITNETSYFIMNFSMGFTVHAHYNYSSRDYDIPSLGTPIRFNTDTYSAANNGSQTLDTTGTVHSDTPEAGGINVQINTGMFGVRTYNNYRYRGTKLTLTYKKPQRTLDVNGRLDGGDSGGTTGYGTFDVYLNGSCVANDVTDFYKTDIADGTSYEINDIKATNGKVYNGVYSGSASGSMCSSRSVYLKFDTPTYYLDVNGELDGVWQGNLDELGSCDVYINGTCVADDVTDFWQAYPTGTKWEIRDIKTASGKKYRGITPGLSGTIGSSTSSVVLQYTSGSTLSIDPNGGTYKGSSGVTTVNNLSPGETITVDSPTRPGYKFGGYEKSNESYQSYASNTGWTTSHGENVGTYSRSYDGNVSLNEAPDGGYYRTNHVWRGIDSATDNYNYISFPTYTAQAGHTYKISGEVWISEKPSGGNFQLNFYHGDSSNDWKHCMWGISEGWTGKWVKFSIERTFDTTTNDARFEIWTSNLKGLTGNISFWLQGLKITDETTGNDVSMTKIAMGDSDIKLTARWIPLHSTLSYDAQGGSLDSVKSTSNTHNYKIVSNGDYFIQSGLNSSRYLHDYDCSTKNGAKVCTFQGYGANAKQCIWTFERYKNTPYYYIINKYNGKALNLSGDGPETRDGSVEMWTQLDGSNAAQSDFLWYFKDAGDGYVTICNKLTDKALDIPNGEDNDNVKLQQYTSNGTASQKFKLVQTEDNYVTTSVVYNGKYLTATGSSISTGCAFTDKKILWKVRRRGRERYFGNEYSDTYTLEDTTTGLKLNAVYHNGMYIIFNNQYDELCYNNGNLWMEYDDDEKDQYRISVQLADADPSSLPSSNKSTTLADFPTREKYTDSNVYINSATPVKKGCKFLGWNTKEDGSGKTYQPGDLYDVNQDGGNATLYAQWEKAKYNINVKLNGGTLNDGTYNSLKDFSIAKYAGDKFNIGIPAKEKNNFLGWTPNTLNGDAPTDFTANKSGAMVTSKHKEQTGTYESGYDQNSSQALYVDGATWNNVQNTGSTSKYNTVQSGKMKLKAGHTYKVMGGLRVKGLTDSSGNSIAANVNLRLRSNSNQKVSESDCTKISSNGTSCRPSFEITPKSDIDDATFEISVEIPSGTKATRLLLTYEFGIVDTTTGVEGVGTEAEGTMGEGNFTLTAQWAPWKHTVRYDANAKNDTSVKGIPASQSKTANVDITLSSDVPTRNGYTFLGWNTKADGKGTAYAAGAIYKNDQNGGTVTLYAQWTPWKHVLHYNKNVPTSSTSQTVSNMPVDQTKTFGQLMTISNLVPTRKGYTFAGWYTQSNGTGTKYNPGSNYAADQNGGTVNLYAKWTPWTYNIKYDKNVSSSSSSQTVSNMPGDQSKTQEINVILSDNKPTRNGYIFNGWQVNGTGTIYQPGATFSQDGDSNGATITLKAKWTPWKHTVHFDKNVPTSSNSQTVSNIPSDVTKTFDQKLTLNSTKPTRKGYSFKEWNTKADGSGTSYAAGGTYDQDHNGGTVTLYAIWTAWTHTVTYNKNVPSNAPSNTTAVTNLPGNQTKTYEKNLTLSTTKPSRTGYNFVEWNTQADGKGTSYKSGSVYSYDRDSNGGTVTLYAIWTPWKHTVTYNKNVPASSKSQTVNSLPGNQTKIYDQTLTLSNNTPTRTGYTFKEWNTQADGKGTSYQKGASYTYNRTSDGGTVTLYAIWTSWKHTVHYDKNVSSASSSQTVSNMPSDQTKVYETNLVLSTSKPTRNGYIFTGWNTAANGSGTAYAAGGNYQYDRSSDGGTVTLYAQWTAWKHTVHYDKNVPSTSSSQTVNGIPADQTKTFDQKLTLSATKPTRNGYIFSGWNTKANGSGTAYAAGAEYKHDQNGGTATLYAQWTPWKHTVHYNANGGDQSSVPTDQTKTFDQAMILSDKKPTRHGYNFVRWNTKADGTGTSYEVKGNYNHDQNGGTVTLYAIWTPWVHTVHYDANGGDQNSVPNDQKKTYGQSMNVATKVPTRNEYKFLGWTTGKDGSGTFYNPGDAYYHDQNGQTVTLYAKWIQLYTVKYDGNQPAIKGVTVTGSVANQTQGQDESVNLRTNNFKNDSGVYKDWSVGKDAYKYGKRNNQFKQYIHPEGFNTNHSKMKEEDTGYNRLASVEGSMVQN